MTLGYDKPLYLLPFDHRRSYVIDMFDFKLPLSKQQHDQVSASKWVIYEGFQQALQSGVPNDVAGVLVDEEYGAEVLRDARQRGFVTALSTERSGSNEFELEYGASFATHIEAFDPTFAKVLVRYNPEADRASNRRQAGRLRQLSDYCRRSRRRFMFELLVPATVAQLARVTGDKTTYDQHVRPALMDAAIRELQDAGIEPDVWKIEGLAQRVDCERIIATVRRDGRDAVGCIVLGRGADAMMVRQWLATAASVTGFIGFAVGRTTFWDAVAGFRAQTLTRTAAVAQIARRLNEWMDIFDTGRTSRLVGSEDVAAGKL